MKRSRMYILTTRPWSFTMTIISVSLGSFFAVYQQRFEWDLYLFVLVGMVVVHAATNAINDYFDVKHGVDTPESPTARYREHFILTGKLEASHVLRFSLILYGIAGVLCIYLIIVRGWTVLIFAAAGIAASFFYTGGPLRFKRFALGEVVVFFMWGPLMMLAAFFVQTGGWEGAKAPLLVSCMQGLWVLLVLLANNIKDIQYDKKVGVRTIANLISLRAALILYTALAIGIYIILGIEIITGIIPLLCVAAYGSLPFLITLIKAIKDEKDVPPDADPRTAQVGMIFGLLLIASLIVNYIAS